MELYEVTLHFPAYNSAGGEEFTLRNTDYYDSPEAAISKWQTIAKAFVVPCPDYWYLEDDAGLTIWTDSPEEVKQAIRYDLMGTKPAILPVTKQ